jgi:hypothetical protein
MAWNQFTTKDRGTWQVEPQQLALVLQRFAFSALLQPFSKVVTTSQQNNYDPLSWISPDTQHVETSFDKIRPIAKQQSEGAEDRWTEDMQRDPQQACSALANLIGMTRANHRAFADKMGSVSRQSCEATNTYLAELGILRDTVKLGRDACFSGVMTCATMMTGPVAAGFILTGGVLTCLADYQDHQDWHSAAVEGITTCATAIIPLPASRFLRTYKMRNLWSRFSAVEKEAKGAVLIVTHASVDAVFTGFDEWSHERDVLKALRSGATTVITDLAGPKLAPLLKKIPRSVKAMIKSGKTTNAGEIKRETLGGIVKDAMQEVFASASAPAPAGRKLTVAAPTNIPDQQFVSQFVLRKVN